jgi:hypothetical protein
MHKSDIAKLSALGLLFLLTIYSGAVKCMPSLSTYFSGFGSSKTPVLQPDFSPCGKYTDENQQAKCRQIVSAATQDANNKCAAYLNKYTKCVGGSSPQSCGLEYQNAQACVAAVVTGALKDGGLSDASDGKMKVKLT